MLTRVIRMIFFADELPHWNVAAPHWNHTIRIISV